MDLPWHGLNCELQVKTITLKSKDLATLAFKKFQTHPQDPLKSSPVLERSAYLLQTTHFPLLTSELESFGHRSTPSDKPWIGPKFEQA